VSASRAVRIPRGRPPPAGEPPAPLATPPELRPNRGGTERAIRIAGVYSGGILALTVILSALDLSMSDAARPGVQQGLELFLVVATLLAVASILYALSPAPRRVEVRADRMVVVGRWGNRRVFAGPGGPALRVVRHVAPSPLTPRPVDVVRVVDSNGRAVTYEIESGLLDARWASR
jgi:hypothetical protein